MYTLFYEKESWIYFLVILVNKRNSDMAGNIASGSKSLSDIGERLKKMELDFKQLNQKKPASSAKTQTPATRPHSKWFCHFYIMISHV